MKIDKMSLTVESSQDEQIAENMGNFSEVKEWFFELNKKTLEREIRNYGHIIQKIIQSSKNQYQALAQSLQEISQSKISKYMTTYNKSIVEIKTIISTKISETLEDMPQWQQQFYESVIKQYQQLKQVIGNKKMVQTISTINTEQLLKLDLLSFILFTCRQKFGCFHLIGRQEILQILQISYHFYEKYSIYHRKVHNILSFKYIGQIQQFIIIWVLLVAKMRVLTQSYRDQTKLAHQIKNHAKKIIIKQAEEYNIYRRYRYNYSEIVFFLATGEKQQFTHQSIHQVMQNYQQICSETDYQMRRNKLHFIKLKYKVSYYFLLKSLWYFENNQKEKVFKEYQESLNIQKLYKILPYIFLKVLSYQSAFQKYKINQILGLQTISGSPSLQQSRAASYIALVAHRRFVYAATMIQAQLYLEKLHREFLIIKKFQFSYQQLKGIKKNPKKTDLVISLMLGTNTKKLQFFCLKKGLISDREYMNTIKKLIPQIKKKTQKFCVVVFEFEFSKCMMFREFLPLINFVKYNYDSNAYLTCTSRYCQLNILLYAYLKHKIISLADSINQNNFYFIVESCLKKELIFFANYKSNK